MKKEIYFNDSFYQKENRLRHLELMKKLDKMSSEEFLETLIKSGICTKKGKLKKFYENKT